MGDAAVSRFDGFEEEENAASCYEAGCDHFPHVWIGVE
jgi:hypothetical protein